MKHAGPSLLARPAELPAKNLNRMSESLGLFVVPPSSRRCDSFLLLSRGYSRLARSLAAGLQKRRKKNKRTKNGRFRSCGPGPDKRALTLPIVCLYMHWAPWSKSDSLLAESVRLPHQQVFSADRVCKPPSGYIPSYARVIEKA